MALTAVINNLLDLQWPISSMWNYQMLGLARAGNHGLEWPHWILMSLPELCLYLAGKEQLELLRKTNLHHQQLRPFQNQFFFSLLNVGTLSQSPIGRVFVHNLPNPRIKIYIQFHAIHEFTLWIHTSTEIYRNYT